MINAAYLCLGVGLLLFGVRIVRGPSLSDRVIGIDGTLVTGAAAIMVHAVDTGRGSYLPVALVASLVSFISTAVVARFVEGRR